MVRPPFCRGNGVTPVPQTPALGTWLVLPCAGLAPRMAAASVALTFWGTRSPTCSTNARELQMTCAHDAAPS
jgi:hypothetical protein